jgi:hypothetical protein
MCHPEELHIRGRELYIYFPNRMARPKLAWPLIEKTLKISGTGRNWSPVTKLLQVARVPRDRVVSRLFSFAVPVLRNFLPLEFPAHPASGRHLIKTFKSID